MMVLFVCDWHNLPPNCIFKVIQFVSGLILLALMLVAVTLKGIFYPWASGFVCLLAGLVTLAAIRLVFFPEMGKGGSQFYRIASVGFIVCAMIVLVVSLSWFAANDKWWNDDTKDWLAAKNADVYTYLSEKLDNVVLSYTHHCKDQSKLVSLYPKEVETSITSKCKTAKTVWFLQWCGPIVVAICDCVCAALCALVGYESIFEESRKRTAPTAECRVSQIDRVQAEVKRRILLFLKRGIFILSVSIGLMYASLYVSGAAVNLGSALLCLGSFGATFICIWMYHELSENLIAAVKDQSFATYVVEAMQSDWLRAFVTGSIHVFIPILAFMDITRQRVRRCRGWPNVDYNDMFTTQGRQVVDEISKWKWVGIFQKVIIIAELLVLLIVGSKFTFVFFSWLNERLAAAELSIGVLSVLVYVLGFGMFMCPIVPGSAVYLFAGVVLGAQAQLDGGIGIWGGTVIGCVVGTIAKLCACVGQYMLGRAAGSYVKVQQFVGVDKVPTRAMEQVLNTPGFKVGKISLLVAGPDFPVSMLCGILKLNIPMMLCGTLPVIVVSIIPQTLVGALLTKDGGDSGIWSMLSTGVTAFAALFQAAATFVYIFSIMRTIEKDGEKLAVKRPEHQAVADLTAKEEDYVQAYAHCTTWNDTSFDDHLKVHNKLLVFSSVVCFLLAGTIMCADFVMSEKYCFRSFSITNRIGDSYDNDGLNNNAWNLVMTAGWVALGFVVLGFILNYVFGMIVAATAKRHQRSDKFAKYKADLEEKRSNNGTKKNDEQVVGKPLIDALAPSPLTVIEGHDA
jgi:hypothetical protein